ncbi:MAG TPA: MFS transporter [Anaerolineales bacterium]|nr:MFS transporter [Anaerolineales bacterium]
MAFFVTRTVINTAYRMVYPFLPAIARGLNVDVQAVTLAITARSSLGIAAPLLGSSADRSGQKRSMVAGLALAGLGLTLVALSPSYGTVFVALLGTAVGRILFDPAMQAYLADRVSYAQRGLAIAATELGWSLPYLIGMPLVGWLMARQGWASPFPWLAFGTLGTAALLAWMLPADPGRPSAGPSMVSHLQSVLRHPAAIAGLVFSLLASFANESVSIVFGLWMENSFGLQVAALGAASAVIGMAELGGEGLVAILADRLGKRRAVALGIILNSLAGLALPVVGTTTAGALVALFVFYITFEFTIVSSLPLMTELVPAARATTMSANISAISVGRSLGALTGPSLFAGGILANASASVGLNLAALAVLVLFVREDHGPHVTRDS